MKLIAQQKEVTAQKSKVILMYTIQKDAFIITIIKKTGEDLLELTLVKCVLILQAVQLITNAFIMEKIA